MTHFDLLVWKALGTCRQGRWGRHQLMGKEKKPKKALKGISPKADAERLEAHLKLIDDLASDAKKAEGETDVLKRSDDAESD
ncbi:hypothetical protein [Bradyrhizobium betae]|uniref:Uncharacterized protein n=1 Tax=Bradyrhizobium betae TaxID=244734 RepID=A0A4Q1UIH7_9BRAD|nr:hypothetical protein [Bradyrhizobium betae]RXT34659.1 hypothetical protein B5V03_38710 [Bradyrhizobium betae]